MFKKRKIDLSAGGQKAPSPAAAAGLRKAGLSLLMAQQLLAIMLVMSAAVLLLFFAQQQQRSAVAEQTARTVAQVQAARIAQFARIYQGIGNHFMQSSRLVELVRNADAEGLREQALQLKRLLPDGASVRFFPFDWDQTDERSTPPVSYASLDLLRMVEKSGTASRLEVHQFNTEYQHLAMAVPIGSVRGVLGTALISLPFSLLQQAMADLNGQGVFQLQQVAGGNAVPIVASPGGDGMEVVGELAIPGTIWQIAYGVDNSQLEGGELFNLGILAVAALLLLITAFLLHRMMQGRFRQDQATLFTLVEGLSQGRSANAPQALTAEMQVTFNMVAQLGTLAGRRLKGGVGQAVAEQEGSRLPTEQGVQVAESETPAPPQPVVATAAGGIPEQIFGAYDIRGVVGVTLTEEIVYQLGRAIGSEAYDRGQQTVMVARDGRDSSPALCDALCRGLMESGRDVVDIGMVPTPLLYFATHFLGSNTGVMVTGSHNPPDYNGLKIVLSGEALSGAAISALHERIRRGDLLQGQGVRTEQNLIDDYIKRVTDDVQLSRPLKVVVDCGNGVAGVIAPQLLSAIGCEVIELFCDVDGAFPHHHPDPGQPENLADLTAIVRQQGADLGLAFDGDGDRLGVVDGNGKVIWPDRVLMLLARDVLLRQPGADVIFDVKSTRHLAGEILAYGGRPILWKSGHSLMKAKMRETGALIAGELTGHIFIKERWYGFDDALYAAARLLEVLSAEVVGASEVFAELPEGVATHELVMPVVSAEAHELMETFAARAEFADAKIIDIDGIRAEFKDGWGLIRASNTTPSLVFRFEADSDKALSRIQELFREQLQQLAPEETPPF